MADPLSTLAAVLEAAQVDYALIGAHGVNAWLEPRLTADIDLTVQAGTEVIARVRAALESAGFTLSVEHGGALPSGPDFARFRSRDGVVIVEIQAAKTELQRQVLERARSQDGGIRVATAEDLIVLKLIADRPKDQIDLHGLRLPSLDWPYVERWAREWGVAERLAELRSGGR